MHPFDNEIVFHKAQTFNFSELISFNQMSPFLGSFSKRFYELMYVICFYRKVPILLNISKRQLVPHTIVLVMSQIHTYPLMKLGVYILEWKDFRTKEFIYHDSHVRIICMYANIGNFASSFLVPSCIFVQSRIDGE